MLDPSWWHQLQTSDKINVINAAGAWFSGVGTLLAVAVALYLARFDRIIKVRIMADYHRVGWHDDLSNMEDACVVTASNAGVRSVTISGIGWRFGWGFGPIKVLKKECYQQKVGIPSIQSPIPITLAESEAANWVIPFDTGENGGDWLNCFSKTLGRYPRIKVLGLRVIAYTTHGKSVQGPVTRSMKNVLVAAAEANNRGGPCNDSNSTAGVRSSVVVDSETETGMVRGRDADMH